MSARIIERVYNWFADGVEHRRHPRDFAGTNFHTPRTQNPLLLARGVEEVYTHILGLAGQAGEDLDVATNTAYQYRQPTTRELVEALERAGRSPWPYTVERAKVLGLNPDDVMAAVYRRCGACQGSAEVLLGGEPVGCGRCNGTGRVEDRANPRPFKRR